MTISTETRRAGPYSGNGSTQVFAFTFKTLSSADLVVVTTTSGVDTVKTLTTHYTVSLNADQDASPGGSITMLTAPASGTTLTIISDRAFAQTLNVQNAGAFLPTVLNSALDTLVIQTTQLLDQQERSLRGALSDGVIGRMPSAAERAGLFLAFDDNGDPIASVGGDVGGLDPADLATVAGLAAEIEIVADADLDIGTVADNIGDVNTVAGWLDLGGERSITVTTLSALQAVTGQSENDTAQMLGRSAAGDGGGGLFRWVTGDQSANVTLDPGQGVWIAPTSASTGASGAWRRVFNELINAAWYGFSTSATAAANTTAINYAFNYLRSVFAGGSITTAGEPPCGIQTGPGQFSVTSVNATQIRSKGWRWEAYGTQLNCATDMAVVVDLTHSRGYSIRNLVIKGDETTPPLRGFQTGYMDGATSSGDYVLDNCHTYGKFEQAAFYNGGSEETVLLKCRFRNTNNTVGAGSGYAAIFDGFNWWGKFSDYLTPANGDHMAMAVTTVSAASTATVTTAVAHGLTTGEKVRFFDVSGSTDVDGADALWEVASTPTTTTFTITGTNAAGGTGGWCWRAQANSMVNNKPIETSFFKDNGGRAMWMSSNVQSFRMSGYIYTPNDDAVLVYFRPSFATLTPYSNDFDVAFEGTGLSSLFYLYEGETTTNKWAIGNWKIKDHGPQNDDAIFATNAATSIFNFIGLDLDIAAFAGSSINVVDATARYRMQGRISTRNSTAGVIGNIPEFYGDLIVPDPTLVTTLPAGSYRILCRDFDGTDGSAAIYKGIHRFYGGIAEISAGIENENQVRVGDSLASAPGFRTTFAVMADDSALTIDLPGTTPSALLAIATTSGSFGNGLYWTRASASPTSVALTSGGTPATLSTGIKTGTSGTDGVFTISPHTDGNVYLENRSGASLSVTYTVISQV